MSAMESNMFIDAHCHILPALDDGAENLNESCEIIMDAYRSGVGVMIATPHYKNKLQCSPENNKFNIFLTYRNLKQEIKKRDIPVNIFLGSEMLCGNDLKRLYDDNEFITINNSRYILVEFPFDDDIRRVEYSLNTLLSLGLVPVIAHPERYFFLMDNPDKIFSFANMGCKIQVNKGSILGKYGENAKNFSRRLLYNNLADIIASDCHDTAARDSDMTDACQYLVERYPWDYIKTVLHDNPKKMLLDKPF